MRRVQDKKRNTDDEDGGLQFKDPNTQYGFQYRKEDPRLKFYGEYLPPLSHPQYV